MGGGGGTISLGSQYVMLARCREYEEPTKNTENAFLIVQQKTGEFSTRNSGKFRVAKSLLSTAAIDKDFFSLRSQNEE